MQEFKDGKVISGQVLPQDIEAMQANVFDSLERLQRGDVDQIRVGKFPLKGESFEVNGLVFQIIDSIEHHGQLTAKLQDGGRMAK